MTSEALILLDGHVWERDLDRILSALIIQIAKHGHAYDQGTNEHILHGKHSSPVLHLIFKVRLERDHRGWID
jgi:hypothetical protein